MTNFRLPFASNELRSASVKPTRHLHCPAGFTLLELLVVIVIIGLLAAYVGPKYFAQLGKSEVTIAKAQIEAFDKALDTYRLNVGRYPTTEEGLAALLVKPATAANWNGPYLKKEVPLDPWGHAYLYRSPGSKGDFEVISYGKDGQPGGTDENADITN
jgi:general secretion pathway protein G